MQLRAAAIICAFAAALACGPNEGTCNNGQCYNPSTTTCTQDAVTNNYMTCPTGAPSACNGACFNPSAYHCANGGLQWGPAAAQTPSTSSTSSSSTTSSTSATPVTSASGSSCTQGSCGSGLCSCAGQCYLPSQYTCAPDQFTGKEALCYGTSLACNGNCYNTAQYHCSASGTLAYGAQSNAPTPAASTSATSSAAAATSSTATPTTSSAPVNVGPAPAPAQYPTQTADLRIINNCKSTLWFEGRYGGSGAPIPGQSTTTLQALPGSYVDYTIPSTGLSGSRFWAKYGCDDEGRNCLIGDAMQYWPNPPGGCPPNGCTPPIDSLFEATWGCPPGSSCNSQNPTTWFDTSQVDGWTIPYKLTANGDTSGCDCTSTGCGFSGVDASNLDLASCPSGDNLADNALYPNTIQANGETLSLSSVDLRFIVNNTIVGCMSPCKRLTWGYPYGLQQSESSGAALWMCCPTPTPNDCSPSNGCITPQACRAGPIENTQFVEAVHSMAPGVYSFSYDDGVGLHACPAGVVTYTMTFCPAGSAQYPLPL